jgi:diketogulonate reductase-like aldo/keto reductase
MGHPLTVSVQGVPVPAFLYGTAWKEEATAGLTLEAIEAGFRGIDTANQRRHYHEAGAGSALRSALERRLVTRDEIFLQTKYTYVEGQDSRLPYDPAASHPEQVRQSFDSSLAHFGVHRIDSLLIHGPQTRRGLTKGDREVWTTMESLRSEGRVRLIGVSNVTVAQLEELCAISETPPAFVQNRCFARTGWDRDVREVCRREGVVYQGFSLLTANVAELRGGEAGAIARRHGKTLAQVVFRFALHLGMICLTGTTDRRHMEQDLAAGDFDLEDEEIATMESVGSG